jgi:hypothetical protein
VRVMRRGNILKEAMPFAVVFLSSPSHIIAGMSRQVEAAYASRRGGGGSQIPRRGFENGFLQYFCSVGMGHKIIKRENGKQR